MSIPFQVEVFVSEKIVFERLMMVARRVKALATEPDDLSALLPKPTWRRENQFLKVVF